jgi:hypothetical protein
MTQHLPDPRASSPRRGGGGAAPHQPPAAVVCQGMAALAAVVAASRSLHHLDLSANKFTAGDVQALSRALHDAQEPLAWHYAPGYGSVAPATGALQLRPHGRLVLARPPSW